MMNIKKWPSHEQIGTVDEGTSVQKGAAVFVLLGMLTPEEVTSNSSSEKPGCLATIIGAILGAITTMFLHSWPGRIGVLYGLVFGILGTIMQHGGIAVGIFLCVVLMLICGALGLLAGFISSKLSRHGNFGALIGSGVTGIAFVVIAVIGKVNLTNTFLPLLGAVPGLVISAIVGLIIKKK